MQPWGYAVASSPYLYFKFFMTMFFDTVALLIQAADKWRSQHEGQLPKSYADKQAFKELLRSWEHSIDGIPIEVIPLMSICFTRKGLSTLQCLLNWSRSWWMLTGNGMQMREHNILGWVQANMRVFDSCMRPTDTHNGALVSSKRRKPLYCCAGRELQRSTWK